MPLGMKVKRGDVPVVADGFRGRVDGGSRAVEDAYLITELVCGEAMDFHAEVEARPDVRRHGIQGVGHDDGGRERRWQCGHQRFAQRGQVAVREGRLELSDAHGELVPGGHVDPRLLQDGPAAGRRVDGEVEGDAAPCLPGEAEHGVGHGEARVGQVVLVVGLVQPLVVVPVDVGCCLHQQIRFEHEVSPFRLDGESFASGERHHAVLAALFVLCHGGEGKSREHGHQEYLFHCFRCLHCFGIKVISGTR